MQVYRYFWLSDHCCRLLDRPSDHLASRWAQEAVRVTAGVIAEACNGLMHFLRGVRGPEGPGERPLFREQLRDAVREMDAIEWMVPPMLQKR